MSDSTEAAGATRRADQALGTKRDVVVAAVEAARQKIAAEKVPPLPPDGPVVTPGERRNLDRPPVGEAVDKALGKSREEAVKTVEIAKEILDRKPDTEPSEKPEPDDGKVGRMLADVRERERKLEADKQAHRRAQSEFEGYKKRVEEELAKAREINALAATDPFAFFEKFHGIKRDAWGLATNGRRPEENIRDARVENELAALRREREVFTAQREAETREQVRARELDKFESDARAGASRWALASRWSKEKLRTRGWEIAVQHAQRGASLSNEEILDRIEEELSEIVSLRETKHGSAKAKAAETRGSEEKPSLQPTLTSQGAGEAAEAKLLPSKMKREDMIRHTARVLDEMRARSAAK